MEQEQTMRATPPNEAILQEMYEYSKMVNSEGKEYVVRGARVRCNRGSDDCVLNLPSTHGAVTADNRSLIAVSDTGNSNVKGFGTCYAGFNKEECYPQLGLWDNGGEDVKYIQSYEIGEPAVVVGAETLCHYGGRARIITSGQTIPEYVGEFTDSVPILEDVKGNWNGGIEFLGNFHAEHSGVYNLGIHADNIGGPITGSVFMYRPVYGLFHNKLVYDSAYQLKEYQYSIKFQPELWTTWVDLVLSKDTDYYFEIDCPGIDSFSYKIMGSYDKKKDTVCGFASWSVDEDYIKNHSYNYTDRVASDNGDKTICFKIYMDKLFMKIFRRLLTEAYYKATHKSSKNAEDALGAGAITVIGLFTTAGGVALTVIDTILSMIPSDIEKIVSIIDSYSKKNTLSDDARGIVLTFYDLRCGEGEPKYKIKDSVWKGHYIEGYKYLIGGFQTVEHTEELENAYNTILKAMEDINNIYNK